MISIPSNAGTAIAAPAVRSKTFRRLKADELVSRGDFTANDRQEFEPWDGPTGFRADAFVKAIYRKHAPATKVRKSA
jgi:hypothetical protein